MEVDIVKSNNNPVLQDVEHGDFANYIAIQAAYKQNQIFKYSFPKGLELTEFEREIVNREAGLTIQAQTKK